MEKKINNKKIKWHNRIFFKTYISFTMVILIFALLVGIVYMRLYTNATVTDNEKQLSMKAKAIAARCLQYSNDGEEKEWTNYLIMLSEMEQTEVWVIANPDADKPLSSKMAISMDVAMEQYLNEGSAKVVVKALNGEVAVGTSYSKAHECSAVSAASPVKGNNGEVQGVILLNLLLLSQEEVIDSGWVMIFVSTLIAIVVAFVLAIYMAERLSRPIASMRRTALKLAAGDYKSKTQINSKDEIGDLANTLDFLSDKLSEAEKERNNNEKMRMDFFANVSHELRTPITVVRGYTESLVDGVVTSEEQRQKCYNRMLGECQGMERLVGDLLLLSKMQNPDFKVEKEPVSLRQIFDDVERNASIMAKEKNVSIIVEAEDEFEAYMINGDYVRLRQMFMIIMDNAIKFSNNGGRVWISLSGDEVIRVSLRDEGVGISEEELPNIFEKFYKSKLRQNAKGSGLGLMIAKHIAQKHGSDVEVISKKGEGTEFVFHFQKLTQLNP